MYTENALLYNVHWTTYNAVSIEQCTDPHCVHWTVVERCPNVGLAIQYNTTTLVGQSRLILLSQILHAVSPTSHAPNPQKSWFWLMTIRNVWAKKKIFVSGWQTEVAQRWRPPGTEGARIGANKVNDEQLQCWGPPTFGTPPMRSPMWANKLGEGALGDPNLFSKQLLFLLLCSMSSAHLLQYIIVVQHFSDHWICWICFT